MRPCLRGEKKENQGTEYAKSGVASAGGFSTSLATIATYTVQADDEEMGGLGGKHCQGYE
jgi:hypothetical protein